MSYNMPDNDEEERKLYCGNLSEKVTEEILYELFLQAGPLEKVHIPRNGSASGFAFITFKHECSVPYAIELFEDTSLFGSFLKLRARRVPNHQRSQSMPIKFGQRQMDYDNGYNSQDFDSLLQMSTSMLHGRGGPPMEMGPPRGRGPPTHRGHSMGGGGNPPSRREPPPPGEEDPDNDQPWNEQGDTNRDNLSQSSLQGNWSARNSSHMLPDDNRKSRHQSRRDYDNRGRRDHRDSDDYSGGGHRNDSGYRGYNQGGYNHGGYNQGGYNQGGYNQGGYNQGGYNQGGYNQGGYNQGGYDRSGYDQGGYSQGGYDQGGYNRNRNYGNRHGHRNHKDGDGFRSRSSDPRERKGRY